MSKKPALFKAVVIESGRVTIEKPFRKAHGIDKGDMLTLMLVEHFKYVKKTEAKKQ